MIVTANCTRLVPCGNNTSRGQNVPIQVEADRVVHTGGSNGYHFGLTPESEQKLADMKARGEFDWEDDLPKCWKKDYQFLRIPTMKGGQQARIIDGKCGPIEKAVYRSRTEADSRVIAAKAAARQTQGGSNG